MDPTRIEISYDPRAERMRGVARHGNVPFDVPFISHVEGNLWQGGCAEGLTLPDDIVNLVSLYPWERYTIRHGMQSELYVTMYDSEDQGMDELNALASWVVNRLELGPTLVHCQAGLNRSGLLAARILMLQGRTANEAISLLREKRSPAVLCNRAFEDYLREAEGGTV